MRLSWHGAMARSAQSFAGRWSTAQPHVPLEAFTTNSITMAQLANVLSRVVNRNVLDQTGLTGNFELDLGWSQDPQLGHPSGDTSGVLPPADAPSISTAPREQLGLKLESSKRPVDVLVVDRVERPSED
jgi:uncharacterized protein (TIGR03435 family)